MFTADQIVAHLVGDYLLQSHWMATEKTKQSFAASVHAAPTSDHPRCVTSNLVTRKSGRPMTIEPPAHNRKAKMPDTQISEEMVDAFIATFNSGVFDRPAFNLPVDERCRCGQCLQEEADARSTVRAALEAALSGHVIVQKGEKQ